MLRKEVSRLGVTSAGDSFAPGPVPLGVPLDLLGFYFLISKVSELN